MRNVSTGFILSEKRGVARQPEDLLIAPFHLERKLRLPASLKNCGLHSSNLP